MSEELTSTPHVIDEDWFVNVDQVNDTSYRVITEFTVEKCLDEPNRKFALSTQDKRLIKKHVNATKTSCTIVKLKRLDTKTREHDQEFVNFDGHWTSSRISFVGYDTKGRSHKVSQDWVELNFKNKFPKHFKKIMDLQPGQSTRIDQGSSSNTTQFSSKKFLRRSEIDLIGPKVEFVQKNEPSCLASSLASALSFINKKDVALRLMKHYNEFNTGNSNRVFSMKNVLEVTFHNHGRQKTEKRWRCNIKKLRNLNVFELLQDVEIDSLIHCVLCNHHTVVLYDKWIFDPTLPKALPRDEKHLRFSAQTEVLEDSNSLVLFGYKYNW